MDTHPPSKPIVRIKPTSSDIIELCLVVTINIAVAAGPLDPPAQAGIVVAVGVAPDFDCLSSYHGLSDPPPSNTGRNTSGGSPVSTPETSMIIL